MTRKNTNSLADESLMSKTTFVVNYGNKEVECKLYLDWRGRYRKGITFEACLSDTTREGVPVIWTWWMYNIKTIEDLHAQLTDCFANSCSTAWIKHGYKPIEFVKYPRLEGFK